MKVKRNLNYDFKSASDIGFNKTKASHFNKMIKLQKMETKGDLRYNYIIGTEFADEVVTSMVLDYPTNMCISRIKKEIKEVGLTQVLLNNIKQRVNYRTRQIIQRNLEYYDIKKSWNTAFYVLHYDKINKIMKLATKKLIREYL